MTEAAPVVLSRTETRLSAWSTVVARSLVMPGKSAAEDYHSLRQADYVSLLAVCEDGRIPLVRQYRPALERYTLELPGGLRDGDEPPAHTALRELAEETGLTVLGKPQLLGCLVPDTGRLENRLWGYWARTSNEVALNWQPEAGVELLLVTRPQLQGWIRAGEFDHALHIALIGLALIHGWFEWND